MRMMTTAVKHVLGAGRLFDIFPAGAVTLDRFPELEDIEERARVTQKAGAQPLWEGYRHVRRGHRSAWKKGVRTSDQVRTKSAVGAGFHRLLTALRPNTVVEFGTAFGVSGMFFLSALEANGHGRLYTFDPNATWRALALENLSAVSDRYVSTLGTFEDTHDRVLPMDRPIDIAFVDGIHTADFVYPQIEILKRRMRSGGVLILDDIRFAPDMLTCWEDLARRDDVGASLELGSRVGLIELA